MDKVKTMLAAGVSLATAVREAVKPRSLREAALASGFNPTALSSIITGSRTPTDKEIDGLIAMLGGTREDWLSAIADAMRGRADALAAG